MLVPTGVSPRPECHLLLLSPGQRATWQPCTASGFSPSQLPPLSLPLQTTCRCRTPSPQLAEHCAQTDRQTLVTGVGDSWHTATATPEEYLQTATMDIVC